jgi:hypothetical protein
MELLYANGHPNLDKGRFVSVTARIPASGGKFMTKAEIAAKLPRMESFESVSFLYENENVAEAREIESRLEKGIAAPLPGYRLLNVQDDPETFSTAAFLNGLAKQKGGKFQVPQQEGIHILEKVVDSLRHAETVNQIDLYKTIGGYDGSTPSVGAEKLKRLAGSDGRRNTCLQSSCRSLEAQGFSGTLIQSQRDLVELRLRDGRQVGSSGEVLSQQ